MLRTILVIVARRNYPVKLGGDNRTLNHCSQKPVNMAAMYIAQREMSSLF